jgi:hypothetical protein
MSELFSRNICFYIQSNNLYTVQRRPVHDKSILSVSIVCCGILFGFNKTNYVCGMYIRCVCVCVLYVKTLKCCNHLTFFFYQVLITPTPPRARRAKPVQAQRLCLPTGRSRQCAPPQTTQQYSAMQASMALERSAQYANPVTPRRFAIDVTGHLQQILRYADAMRTIQATV